jgi:hypothetical protein
MKPYVWMEYHRGEPKGRQEETRLVVSGEEELARRAREEERRHWQHWVTEPTEGCVSNRGNELWGGTEPSGTLDWLSNPGGHFSGAPGTEAGQP